MTCTYCFKVFHGGGIHRMKQHLAGVTGSVTSCPNVDPAVRLAILTCLQENDKKSKEKRGDFGVESPFGQPVHEFVGDEVQEVPPPRIREISMNEAGTSLGKGKRKTTAPTGIHAFFKGGRDSTQPTIKACLQSKDKWQNTDMAIALWFYDACIPINAVNSPFFQKAIDQIASMGHGYKAPSYHSLRVTLLRDAKKDVQLVVDSFRNTWAETGCTIMGDGWKDSRQRPLINFLVYCPKGISFIKSIDASDIVTNAENLCNLFAEIVEMVGSKNVVHLVTDNASNYKAAGTLLNERYPTICWSPCAAHCINLILKDIGEMGTVKSLVALAATVTVFVYNHKYVLNWLRKTNGWREIIRPGETRFATTFIALKSLHDHKDSLQALVTSGDYKKFLKMNKGKEVKQIVLDDRFWNNCLITVRIMGPIIRLLRVCDTDERPSLGYVYKGMFRAITGIKKLFRSSERLYKPYIDIINDRWDRMLRKNLHATAYFLNPAFQYDTATFSTHPEIANGLLDYIESKVDWCSVENLTREIGMYREREGSFGRKLAILTSKKDRPENWWKLFGCDAPNLQKLAIRVLSQTASSSGCERNWSVFERIHTKKRNRLEHQRLNDLVYVHYNLRLQYRHNQQKRSYDPVDYESIDKTEFWVVEEEQEGELDYEELEEELEELPIHGQCSNSEQLEG
ncbi:uncharacterized protein [Coffea arabica]|uniref:BED-type domain-containing protein n=1 Tax=Coffea arabica TaxID=13443 RepID=A0A6P6VI62_COFAR